MGANIIDIICGIVKRGKISLAKICFTELRLRSAAISFGVCSNVIRLLKSAKALSSYQAGENELIQSTVQFQCKWHQLMVRLES